MAILLSTTFANALLQHGGTAVADQLGGGTLVAYSGTPPVGPNEALSGNTALATFTFAAGASWSAPAGGVIPLAIPVLTVNAASTGTAAFFRMISSGAAALVQGTVTVNGGGGDWQLNTVTFTTGDLIAITGSPSIAWTVT